MEKYRERIYLLVEATLLDSVPVLQGGIYGGVDDISLQLPAWNRDGYRLGPDTGQSDKEPPPVV